MPAVSRDTYPPFTSSRNRSWDAGGAVARLRNLASSDGSGSKEKMQ